MKTILVIDDELPILEMYGIALADQGYRVITAASGAEGIELARRHLPDLILCDINMPGMDGRAVLQAVREDPDLGARQFVFMTGNTRDVTPRRGMELGADDFLVKPFSLQDLASSVRARLDRASVHWRVEDRIVAGLRADLHSALPHEFFTPLNGILGLVEVLRGDLEQLSRAEMVELLDAIEDSGWRLHRSLRNYLLLIDLQAEAAPAAAPPTSGPVLASAIHAGVAAATRRHCRTGDVQVALAHVLIRVVPGDVTIVTEELVDNACRFSRQGTPVRVTLGADGVLEVSDQGRGMTAEQIARIGAFRGLDRARVEQEGLGLGLFLVEQLARHCGASTSIDSEDGKGTRVRVAFRTDPA
jgi:two-component system, sensor histidine kinase and response regulator